MLLWARDHLSHKSTKSNLSKISIHRFNQTEMMALNNIITVIIITLVKLRKVGILEAAKIAASLLTVSKAEKEV